MQCAKGQERWRNLGLLARQHIQLCDGVAVPLAAGQQANENQTQRRLCLRCLQIAQHQGFTGGALADQFHCQQHGSRCCGVESVRLFHQCQRAVGIAGFQPGAALRHARSHASGAVAVGLQRVVDDLGHALGVAGLLQQAGQRRDQIRQVGRQRLRQQQLQRFADGRGAVQQQQDLQLKAQRVG